MTAGSIRCKELGQGTHLKEHGNCQHCARQERWFDACAKRAITGKGIGNRSTIVARVVEHRVQRKAINKCISAMARIKCKQGQFAQRQRE